MEQGQQEGRLLDGKVAIITGAGPGMGRSIALRFAAHGANVVVAARRRESVTEVAREVSALGMEGVARVCDISDQESCRSLVDATREQFGRVDILVQNAHHEGDWTPAASADADEWHRIMDINFFGALHLVQASVPVMDAGGGGAILLVNSGAAVSFPPNMGAYSTSKAALAALTRTLARELGPKHIRVNGIFLGPVLGDNLLRMGGQAAAAAGISLEDWVASKAAELPIGHVPTPDECAGSALFFVSDLSAPVTGQHLAVNGGQWLS